MSLKVRGQPHVFLRQLALSIRACPQKVRADAARRAKTRVLARIDLQFDQGRDPYGRHWKKPRDGHRPVMIRSGRLRAGYAAVVIPSGTGLSVRISNRMDYAEKLQRGTDRMDPRKQVPDGPLPDEWLEDLRASYQEAIDAWHSGLRL